MLEEKGLNHQVLSTGRLSQWDTTTIFVGGTSSVRQQSAPGSGRQMGVATLEGVGQGHHTEHHHNEMWRDRRSKDGVRERGRQRGQRTEGQAQRESGKGVYPKSGAGERETQPQKDSLETDELLALDVLGVKRLPPPLDEKNRDLRLSGPVDMEPRQTTSTPEPSEQRDEENSYLDCSMGEEVEGERDGNKLFSYFSPPRSAGSRHTPSVRTACADHVIGHVIGHVIAAVTHLSGSIQTQH